MILILIIPNLINHSDSLIFLGSLVRVVFLANVCIVSDQTSEAGNVKYCPQLHARSGLRFIILLQEDA
jgi:hypothetical protein